MSNRCDTAKLPRGNIVFFVFTNGITYLGLFFLFVAIAVNSAAVSDSPLAEGTLLDETGCQGYRLVVLGHYLSDLGAATSQEYMDMDKGGQITREKSFIWFRSGLRLSPVHLQTHCTGQISAPTLCPSDQAGTSLLAQR